MKIGEVGGRLVDGRCFCLVVRIVYLHDDVCSPRFHSKERSMGRHRKEASMYKSRKCAVPWDTLDSQARRDTQWPLRVAGHERAFPLAGHERALRTSRGTQYLAARTDRRCADAPTVLGV